MKSKTDKPEILIFMSDQHNASYMRCAGNPVVETPNMDRIAAQGVRFENSYTSCPLCVPARMSFMTGQLPSTLSVFHNEETLRSDHVTFAHVAGAMGYETALVGRMHFVGEDQRHGFEKRFGDDFNRIWGRGGLKRTDLGEYVLTPAGDITKLIGGGTSPVLEYDRQVISSAIKYINADCERPRLTVVGVFGPHHPFVAPPKLYRHYREIVDFPLDYGKSSNFLHPVVEKHRQSIDDNVMLDIRAAYYGMITQVDRQMGAVYDSYQRYLKKNNKEGVFIYLSDHGEMAGQYGLYRKEMFFDGSSKIPMIICGDGISKGKTVQDNVSIMDISATLCEFLGGDQLPEAIGQTLTPYLFGDNKTDNERAVFSEYIYRDTPGAMIRKGKYKLICYDGYEEADLLFDLESDPLELLNLAKENTTVCKTLKKELLEWWDAKKISTECKRIGKHHKILAKWGAVSHAEERDLWEVTERARQIPTVR